jgi:hypothetical protein
MEGGAGAREERRPIAWDTGGRRSGLGFSDDDHDDDDDHVDRGGCWLARS